jgi:hypothetical protein
MAMNLNDR